MSQIEKLILTVLTGIGMLNLNLSKGQGIFINSRVLHKMHSENNAAIPNFLSLIHI